MVYITGDTHASFKRFANKNFPEQKDLTKDDYVIICGDFGGVWDVGWESKNEKYWLDWFEERNFTLLFVDGNHENFDRLYGYPVKEWHGGKVHELRPHVLHLMRGQIFDIEGKRFFTFGGASSHDIDAGILEVDDPDFKKKKKELDREYALYRINHLTWWERELATDEEMEEGFNNLLAHNNTVDFIITHCSATSTQRMICDESDRGPDTQTDFFEYIKNHITFTKWFFGHYHDNINISDKEILIYEQIIRIL
jgi:predicted phosphodiesterase